MDQLRIVLMLSHLILSAEGEFFPFDTNQAIAACAVLRIDNGDLEALCT